MEGTLLEFIIGFTPITVVFLVIGLLLLVVEMFHPGFGVAGLCGLICLGIAVVLRANTFVEGLWMTVILLAIVGLLLLIFLHSATKGVVSRSPLILKESIEKSADRISTKDMQYFIGKVGTVLSTLRPSGMADFDGVKLDVVSDGVFIAEGAKVKIQSIEGSRIVVVVSEN